MRKTMILFVFLLVLGMGGMLYAHAALTAAQYNVSFTGVASYGDVSAADGLTVSVQAQLAQHLIWDSAHTFGQEQSTQTDFAFSSKQLNLSGPYIGEAFSLSTVYDFSASASGGNLLSNQGDNHALGQAFDAVTEILRDVASRTQNGERHSEIINLKDYFNYHPINASFFTEQYYYIVHDNEERYISQLAEESEVREVFSSYFKIPVPDDYKITVEICKDSAGDVVEVASTQVRPAWINAVSVSTESGIYFTLQTENVTDLSYINGGFGIYLLPKSTINDDEGTELPTLDYHNLSTVYSLDESVSVQKLYLSEDKSCLNLITVENGALFLTVIEFSTMSEKQKLRLFDDLGDSVLQFASYTDGLLFALLNDARFTLAEANGNSIYKVALSSARDEKLLDEESFASGYYRWYEPLIAWDGERLALLTATSRFIPSDDGYSTGYSSDTCGFVLEIFDESGLKYKGIFENSLDALATQEHFDGRCHLIDSGALSLSW